MSLFDLGIRIKQCKLCDLSSTKSNVEKGIPIGWGAGNKIMIVGLSPSDSRVSTEYAMKPVHNNDTALLLSECLKSIEYSDKDFFITNLVKCSFTDNILDRKYFDICYNRWLFNELVTVSPKKIVCLGDEVYSYLSQQSYLSKMFTIEKVWHHAYIARDRSKMEDWKKQWQKILD